jgi:hypothetical protein
MEGWYIANKAERLRISWTEITPNFLGVQRAKQLWSVISEMLDTTHYPV